MSSWSHEEKEEENIIERTTINEMERITEIYPAFDKRSSDPTKNYGIGSCTLKMVLKGERGAVQFVIYTGWNLPHVTEEYRAKMRPDKYFLFEPMPADIGYHSPKPMYKSQEPIQQECPYLDGKPCYYDGSGLQAIEVYENILLTEGSEGVWKHLEQKYKDWFESTETPTL